jgi:hypothetical protein
MRNLGAQKRSKYVSEKAWGAADALSARRIAAREIVPYALAISRVVRDQEGWAERRWREECMMSSAPPRIPTPHCSGVRGRARAGCSFATIDFDRSLTQVERVTIGRTPPLSFDRTVREPDEKMSRKRGGRDPDSRREKICATRSRH